METIQPWYSVGDLARKSQELNLLPEGEITEDERSSFLKEILDHSESHKKARGTIFLRRKVQYKSTGYAQFVKNDII